VTIQNVQDDSTRPKKSWFARIFSRDEQKEARTIPLNPQSSSFQNNASSSASSSSSSSSSDSTFDPDSYPLNVIRNQKYSAISFFPVCLLLQFKSFINLFYLVVSISQLIPILQVGMYLNVPYASSLYSVLRTSMSRVADRFATCCLLA
jgi:hypothetical protein